MYREYLIKETNEFVIQKISGFIMYYPFRIMKLERPERPLGLGNQTSFLFIPGFCITIRMYNNDVIKCQFFTYSFYPTALKGCRCIVFTHGVRMGGREKVYPAYTSETVRCRKLILGRDIG